MGIARGDNSLIEPARQPWIEHCKNSIQLDDFTCEQYNFYLGLHKGCVWAQDTLGAIPSLQKTGWWFNSFPKEWFHPNAKSFSELKGMEDDARAAETSNRLGASDGLPSFGLWRPSPAEHLVRGYQT